MGPFTERPFVIPEIYIYPKPKEAATTTVLLKGTASAVPKGV